MRICEIEGCENEFVAHGFCQKHYKRFKKYGSPFGGRTETGALLKFINSILSTEEENCIIWPYTRTWNGYGQISFNGRREVASRLVCELVNGKSDKLVCMHLCGKGHLGCVNPRHLEWGTYKQNAEMAIEHGTSTRGDRNSHAKLSVENVQAIKKAFVQGKSDSDLSKIYDVHSATISKIRKGETWRWLT